MRKLELTPESGETHVIVYLLVLGGTPFAAYSDKRTAEAKAEKARSGMTAEVVDIAVWLDDSAE